MQEESKSPMVFLFILAFITYFLIISSFPASGYETGFILKWKAYAKNKITSIAKADFDRDFIANDIVIGSADNQIYAYNITGYLYGSFIDRASITSVGSFARHGSRTLDTIAAGSSSNRIHALYKPWTALSIYETEEDKTPAIPFWSYEAIGDVHEITSGDLEEENIKNFIIASVGEPFESSAKLVVLNATGKLKWSYSTSSPAKAIAIFDLDADSFLSHIAAGVGKTIIVLDKNGKVIWTKNLGNEINALSYADFDNDGEKDDIIAGAGNELYAIDSNAEIIWEKRFNNTIVSISTVCSKKDTEELVDYYLVASGNRLYGVKNKEKPEIIFEYDAGFNITKHISIAYNGSYEDDVALISGNALYVYEKAPLYLPEIIAEKNSSKARYGVNETVEIHLKLKNNGDGFAYNIRVNDANKSFYITRLMPGEEKTISYALKFSKNRSYALEAAEIDYYTPYSTKKTTKSNNLTLIIFAEEIKNVTQNVTENITKIKNVTNQEHGANITAFPKNKTKKYAKIKINITLSKKEVREGEKFNISIKIRNTGENYSKILLNTSLPKEFELLEGALLLNKTLKPNETLSITQSIKAKSSLLKLRQSRHNITYDVEYNEEAIKKVSMNKEIKINANLRKKGMIAFIVMAFITLIILAGVR